MQKQVSDRKNSLLVPDIVLHGAGQVQLKPRALALYRGTYDGGGGLGSGVQPITILGATSSRNELLYGSLQARAATRSTKPGC
jgi:hypothetical protein